jgi:hypothetical protein
MEPSSSRPDLDASYAAWRKRRNISMIMAGSFFTGLIGSFLCFKVFDLPGAGGALVFVCMAAFIAGIPTTLLEYRAFYKHWSAAGLSKAEIQKKWFDVYPPGD